LVGSVVIIARHRAQQFTTKESGRLMRLVLGDTGEDLTKNPELHASLGPERLPRQEQSTGLYGLLGKAAQQSCLACPDGAANGYYPARSVETIGKRAL
jgi:hypothetical protein